MSHKSKTRSFFASYIIITKSPLEYSFFYLQPLYKALSKVHKISLFV